MSGFNNDISNNSGPGSSAEPSMEEILASIRRILKEEETTPANVDIEDDVLVLDHSMRAKPADVSSATTMPVDTGLIEAHGQAPVTSYHEVQHFTSEPAFTSQASEPEAEFEAEPLYEAPVHTEISQTQPEEIHQPVFHQPEIYTPANEDHMPENVEPPHGLMSDEASGAAANSIGALVRSISADRSVAISRGGVTIEDIVRDEIRPLLKAWLDTQLPSLVERIVRSEIERVVDRSTS